MDGKIPEKKARNHASTVEKALYEEKLKHYDADKCSSFDEVVTMKTVKAQGGDESIISFYLSQGNSKRLVTDKPVNYWHFMEGKQIHICGTKVRREDGDYLLVLSAVLSVQYGDAISNLSGAELAEYESLMSDLSPEKKRYLYSVLKQLPETRSGKRKAGTSKVCFESPEEMKVAYKVLHKVIPSHVCDEIERCFSGLNRGSSSEKQNCRKALFNLINYEWIGKYPSVDIDRIRMALDKSHIGMEHAKKVFCREALSVGSSRDHKPQNLLLVGTEGCGKTSLATAFMEAMEIDYQVYNLAGSEDAEVFTGSGRVYENGRSSALFLKCFDVGRHGGIILDEIDKAGEHVINALTSFIDRNLYDEFLEASVDISDKWIIATANNIKYVHPALLSRMTVINVENYTEEEKIRIINDVLVPRMCQCFHMEASRWVFPLEVSQKIVREIAAGKSIRNIEYVVREIFISALERGEKAPKLTVKNLKDYFNWGDDTERIKGEYVYELSAMERKYRACAHLYPESVRERNEELFPMAYKGTDDEKTYAISALKILTNVLLEAVPPVDLQEFRKEMDKTHYGLQKPRQAVERVLAQCALSGTKGSIYLLDGCAGVGKTSLGKVVAKALGRKFIKISLNGVSSSEAIKGFPRTYKGSQAGIIAKNLATEGVCSYSAVVLLDEVDKMVSNGKDDPYNTLHDLLDNNSGFYDQYLETTLPTENILFILTSNDKSKIPSTILDRVEVIDVGGYTAQEKFTIAKQYVIPKLAKEYHLDYIRMSDDTLENLIADYCVSYGVRDVEQAINNLVAAAAVNKNLNVGRGITIHKADLTKALGAKKSMSDDFPKNSERTYGQARALAVMGNQGSTFAIQMVENAFGEGDEVTGLAEGSFAESIKVVKTLLSAKLGKKIPNLHVHALASGIKKDGPSAGLTMYCCMMSFMLKKPLPNVAFTGEIDLYGNVLPIGGTKLKLAAAERAGVETVYLPKENYDRLVEDNELDVFQVLIRPVVHVDQVTGELFGNLCLTGIDKSSTK